VRGLRKDVQSLRQGQQAGGELTFPVLAKKHCIKCHALDVAEEKGGDFVMFEKDGELAVFSAAQNRQISKKVESGAMPVNGKLSEDEKKPFVHLDPRKQPKELKK
jgi:hypothetical protein